MAVSTPGREEGTTSLQARVFLMVVLLLIPFAAGILEGRLDRP